MPKACVVIADDDRLVLATLARGLEEAGYRVLAAGSGEEAISLCKEQIPDIAILDIRMPGLDGIEAARRMRDLAGIPFLVLSAYREDELVEEATDVGALGYLVKPVDVEQIVPAIEAALKRSAEIRKLQDNQTRLISALERDQLTSTAIGVLMERHRLSREAAFEKLRMRARTQRRKLAEIADELVRAAETVNIS